MRRCGSEHPLGCVSSPWTPAPLLNATGSLTSQEMKLTGLGIDKKTFLAMIDSGRFCLLYKEAWDESEQPVPLEEARPETRLHAKSVLRIEGVPAQAISTVRDWARVKVQSFLAEDAAREVRHEKEAWHTLASRLTDEEWDELWSCHALRLGVAEACEQWRAEQAKA